MVLMANLSIWYSNFLIPAHLRDIEIFTRVNDLINVHIPIAEEALRGEHR